MKKLLCFILAVMVAATTVYAKTAIDLTADYDKPTVEELEAGLLFELKPYAAEYLAAAEEYGVNVYFLCAKDGLESWWGQDTIAKNNLGGWRLDSGEYKPFDSVEESIWYRAKNIKVMYLTPKPTNADPEDITGDYFTGYTLEDVNVYYNGTDAWLKAVNGIWYDIEWRVGKYRKEMEGNHADD